MGINEIPIQFDKGILEILEKARTVRKAENLFQDMSVSRMCHMLHT